MVDIQCDSPNHALVNFKQVMTIIDERGASLADFVCSVDNNDRLAFLGGTVTDGVGKVLYRFKEKDLKRTEYSEYLSIDESIHYIDYTPPFYPVTITYEWTIDYNDKIMEFPQFCPQMDYEVSVGKAHYSLTAPKQMAVRYYLHNIHHDITLVDSPGDTEKFILELDSLSPIYHESYALPFSELCPKAIFAPSEFVYCGTKGSLSSWKDYGLWEYSLIDGTEILPDEACRYIHKLTDSLATAREKIEALYSELAKNTRYVAILLGIGGQKPAHASSVWQKGYGDCKGLSNYMRAMLKEIGITSYYVTVSTKNKRLIPEFASIGQIDHAILEIPLDKDTLWLECTNPQLPLGYIQKNIAGHDAIEISPNGGRMINIPAYASHENLKHSTINMHIDEKGNANIDMCQQYRNLRYEQYSYLLRLDKKELYRQLHDIIDVPQADIAKIDLRQDGASIYLETAMTSTQYAIVTGNRLFIPICPLYIDCITPLYQQERHGDMWFPAGYYDEVEITILIPDGYIIESVPADVEQELPFGTFSLDVSNDEHKIIIKNHLQINAGRYDKELFSDFVEFTRKVLSMYNKKIVIKKELI